MPSVCLSFGEQTARKPVLMKHFCVPISRKIYEVPTYIMAIIIEILFQVSQRDE